MNGVAHVRLEAVRYIWEYSMNNIYSKCKIYLVLGLNYLCCVILRLSERRFVSSTSRKDDVIDRFAFGPTKCGVVKMITVVKVYDVLS